MECSDGAEYFSEEDDGVRRDAVVGPHLLHGANSCRNRADLS